MKFATVSKTLIMGAALLLASSSFAATTKASLTLGNLTTVNGAKLKPGDYKLEWEGTGSNVEVSIIKGKTVLAKVPAKIVNLSSPSLHNAAVITKNDDGSDSLTGAQFEGKKFALDLADSGNAMQGGSSN